MDPTPQALTRFTRAAEQLCVLVEEPSHTRDRSAFLWALRSTLAELLAAGFNLPEVDPSENDLPATNDVDHWKDVFASLQLRLGALAGGPGAILDVADAIADVWRDLRNGFDALNAGAGWQDVCWEWRFGLQTHWGRHAVDALGALHDA